MTRAEIAEVRRNFSMQKTHLQKFKEDIFSQQNQSATNLLIL